MNDSAVNENPSDELELDEELDESLATSGKFVAVAAITGSLERDTTLTGNPFKYKIGNSWNLGNKAATDFIDQIERKFDRKNKFHSYFSGLPSNVSPIQNYLAGTIEFVELAKSQIIQITQSANEQSRKSLRGGNLVFIHYKTKDDEDDSGRLLIVMVDLKGAFEFDEKLEPRKLNPVDTDALRQAAMFDLTLFQTIYPNKDGETYLHFIEGKSKSDFFKEALGCDSSISNKQSVSNIFLAIAAFSLAHNLNRAVTEKIKEKVAEHIRDNIGKQVPISDIQHVIDKELPPGHASTGSFSEFSNTHRYQINAVFEATRTALESSISLKINDDKRNYALSVKASSIGYEGSEKPVIVDTDLAYLMIPLTDDDRELIRATIGNPDESDTDDS
ncbi:nucleoid-associated protein [Pseudomonas oryzihabitans]|uniref:nucleoid-associated protein n=1 Tax=Pseudomonas oryzihabitans TaxID=47885 RepID=UPI0028659542|nr:nucleoid-associated protein [Pseudomonas psychrotolerans]MDR6677753.1 nucleoid-associated protein [Pseudomonas psychrotolerans]